MAAEQHRFQESFTHSTHHGLPFEDTAITAEIQLLLDILPERIRREITSKIQLDELIEIAHEVGRRGLFGRVADRRGVTLCMGMLPRSASGTSTSTSRSRM